MKATCVDFARYTQRNLGMVAAALGVLVALNAGRGFACDAAPEGRLDFEAAKLPAANVEVDLSQETFHSLFGIGDAALTGVAESLMKSTGTGDGSKGVRLAADQLEAARKILQLAG